MRTRSATGRPGRRKNDDVFLHERFVLRTFMYALADKLMNQCFSYFRSKLAGTLPGTITYSSIVTVCRAASSRFA
jgi:hypothetical protein